MNSTLGIQGLLVFGLRVRDVVEDPIPRPPGGSRK